MAVFASTVRSSCQILQKQLKPNSWMCVPLHGLSTRSNIPVPPKPKRPPNGYNKFFQEVLRDNPDLRVTKTATLAGGKWRLLNDSEKEKYKPTEESLNEYQKSLSMWTDSLTEEQKAAINKDKARRQKLKLRKQLRTLGKPPRPGFSSFSCYFKSQPIERGDAPASMYLKGLSQMWNKMATEDKEEYVNEAESLKFNYYLELEAWEKDMIEAGNLAVVRKTSLPANIDRNTLKPKKLKIKKKKVIAKKASKKGSKKSTTKKNSSKKTRKSEEPEDVTWMREE